MNTPANELSSSQLAYEYSSSYSDRFSISPSTPPLCPMFRLHEPSVKLSNSVPEISILKSNNHYLTPNQKPAITPDLLKLTCPPVLTSPLSIPFLSVDKNTFNENRMEAYGQNSHFSPTYVPLILNDYYLSPNKTKKIEEKKSRWAKITSRLFPISAFKAKFNSKK